MNYEKVMALSIGELGRTDEIIVEIRAFSIALVRLYLKKSILILRYFLLPSHICTINKYVVWLCSL